MFPFLIYKEKMFVFENIEKLRNDEMKYCIGGSGGKCRKNILDTAFEAPKVVNKLPKVNIFIWIEKISILQLTEEIKRIRVSCFLYIQFPCPKVDFLYSGSIFMDLVSFC